MKFNKTIISIFLVICLILCFSTNVFTANYSGNVVVPGLSGIMPEDTLTLPDNTAWATLTAKWGVRLNFIDWDETVLQTELIPVTDTTPGNSSAPDDPYREGYTFTGWERYDTNDGPSTLNDDGTVTGINGPGPIVYIATYEIIPNPALEVTKKSDLAEGETASLGQTITYTITVKNTGNVTISDITVEDGLEGATIAAGESDTIASLEPGKSVDVHFTYIVTEADVLSGNILNNATACGTDPSGAPVEDNGDVTDTTDVVEGSLEVTKKSDLAEGETARLNQTITYTVTVKNTGNVTISNITVDDELEAAKLAAGESDTIVSLEPGKSVDVHFTYVVTEADVLAGSIKNAATACGTDPNGDPVEDGGDCEDQTEPAVGNLTVSKTIAGNAADSDKAFDFTVTLGDTAVNGIYGDMNFTDGVSTFSLKGGESKTAANLPAGTSYTVTEEDYSADGYETTKRGDKGTIAYLETATAAFTNTNNVEPGSLTIEKTVEGDEEDMTVYFTFTVKFNAEGSFNYTGSKSGTIKSGDQILLKHGESITIQELPAGTEYTVTESENNEYRVSVSGETGTIIENENSVASFNNIKIVPPLTGEDSNTLLWLSLTVISALCMACILFYRNKKGRKLNNLKNM